MSSPANNANPGADEILEMLNAGQSVPPELQEIFSEEAEDHLRAIYDGLDRLQVNRDDRNSLGDIRRAAHTLKGAAGAVGVPSVTRLSHRMEDLLDDLAENNRPVTSEIVLVLLSTADRMQELTGESFELASMANSIAQLYQQYYELLPTAGQDQVDANTESAECDHDEVDEDDVGLSEALAAFGVDLEDDDSFGGILDEDEDASSEVSVPARQASPPERQEQTETPSIESESSAAAAASHTKGEAHIRVPLSRLDEMVRLVGEMIINRSSFAQRLADFTGQIDDLQVALHRLQGVSDDVETRYSIDALKNVERPNILNFTSNQLDQKWFAANSGGLNSRSGVADEFDELEFDRYTEFHLLARTLSEATGDVGAIARECRVLSGDFDALLGRWQRLTRDAQDRLMQIRMVPLRTIVPRLGRSVRSTASQCGKDVRFVVRGDHTEIDKTVLEEIADPLVHLVRNAIDHGIESREDRIAAGKDPNSLLTIEAVNQGTQLTLRIEDDGRGLDSAKIRQRAIEKGLISQDQSLSKQEIEQLIFAPGFSTATSLSDVSGRGVGMDVVRETIHRLKGSIRIDSREGEGLKFTIILPTTLAVTRALVVESGGTPFAIPMQAISQISRLDPRSVRKVGDDTLVEIGSGKHRLRRLSEKLGMATQAEFDSALPMLVIESGDRQVALTVENIIGGQDIVVKSLGDHLRVVPGIIGASISGDGSVIPILDPADLVGLIRTSPSVTAPFISSKRVSKLTRNVLIVDDSVSVRRITASVMRGGGWSVETAKDGVDALEHLASCEQYPDIILLDMEMPRMDGLELLSHLRADEDLCQTPVVMVTSRAGDKHRKRAMQSGATEYVVKPFRDDQLLEIASRLTERITAEAAS